MGSQLIVGIRSVSFVISGLGELDWFERTVVHTIRAILLKFGVVSVQDGTAALASTGFVLDVRVCLHGG